MSRSIDPNKIDAFYSVPPWEVTYRSNGIAHLRTEDGTLIALARHNKYIKVTREESYENAHLMAHSHVLLNALDIMTRLIEDDPVMGSKWTDETTMARNLVSQFKIRQSYKYRERTDAELASIENTFVGPALSRDQHFPSFGDEDVSEADTFHD